MRNIQYIVKYALYVNTDPRWLFVLLKVCSNDSRLHKDSSLVEGTGFICVYICAVMIWLSCSLCGCFLETIQESQQKRFPLRYKNLHVCTLYTLDNAIPNLMKMICPFRDKDQRTGALPMFRRLCLAQGHFSLMYTHRNDSLYRRSAIEGQSLSTHSAIVRCISLT